MNVSWSGKEKQHEKPNEKNRARRSCGPLGRRSRGSDYSDEDFVEVGELLEDLRELGVVVVAATGNSQNAAEYPALFDEVVSVGALGTPSGGVSGVVQHGGYANATLWANSSTASDVDICAFGENVWVLWPMPMDVPGFALTTVSGTSIAAPQVSAAATLLKAQDSNRSAGDVEEL